MDELPAALGAVAAVTVAAIAVVLLIVGAVFVAVMTR